MIDEAKQQERRRKREWLLRYRSSLDSERRLRMQVEEARTRAEKITATLSPAPGRGSGGGGKIEQAVESIIKYQEQLADQVIEGQKLRTEIEAAIDAVGNVGRGLPRQVLYYRYVVGLSTWRTANKLYVSEDWVRKSHRVGLDRLQIT